MTTCKISFEWLCMESASVQCHRKRASLRRHQLNMTTVTDHIMSMLAVCYTVYVQPQILMSDMIPCIIRPQRQWVASWSVIKEGLVRVWLRSVRHMTQVYVYYYNEEHFRAMPTWHALTQERLWRLHRWIFQWGREGAGSISHPHCGRIFACDDGSWGSWYE